MRLIIFLLFISLSVTAQSKKGDTIKIYMYSEEYCQREIDKCLNQIDSLYSIMYFYRNYIVNKETIYKLKVK